MIEYEEQICHNFQLQVNENQNCPNNNTLFFAERKDIIFRILPNDFRPSITEASKNQS